LADSIFIDDLFSKTKKYQRLLLPDLVELLVALQSQQQLKVEELKKKTSYYLTKGLIERYESPSKPGSNNSPKPNSFTPQPQTGPNTPLNNKKQAISNNATPSSAAVLGMTPQLQNGNHQNTDLNTPQRFVKKGINLELILATSTPAKLATPPPRTWVDRVLDAVVGESDGPQHKYALICESCFIHNGLVPPAEYHDASNWDI
jgi:endoplasmic reticulum junction formation protein lunapark